MTRYSNPLPPNQVPNSQGRPAGTGQPPAHHYGEPEVPAWPQQPRTARPAAPAYGEPEDYAPEAAIGGHHQPNTHAAHDPYAALRPDGYGYAQQQPATDHYGLSGYTAPQAASAQQAFGSRAPQQAPAQRPQPSSGYGAADPYAHAASGSYGTTGQNGLGATHSSFGPAAPAQSQQPYGGPQQAYAPAPAPSQPYPSQFANYGAQKNGAGYAAPRADAAQNGHADHWGSQALGGLSVDARDYGHQYANGVQAHGAHQDQWAGADHYGDAQLDPALGSAGYQNGEQTQHASFDQSYAEDEAQYEEEPRRGSWKKIAMLMTCTVVVGGALTFAYSSIMGSGSGGPTPVVKGDTAPTKVKPSEPGGKQFAHADSKIMGRLAEGGSEEPDSNVRKVPVVTVGRDGSIQAPSPTAPEEETRAVVAVPGLTVIDGLGGGGPSPNRPVAPKPQQQQQASPPVQMVTADANPVVSVPSQKAQQKAPSNLVGNSNASETGTVRQAKAEVIDVPPAAAPPKKQKVAAVETAPAAPAGPKPTGAGYVAVLASVPASGSSRIDALKQFADMQQKYGVILQNKTPDIQEANLGEKGTYHRLLVGPPGSRDSANTVCSQLKAEGYSGCWVTAY